MEAERGGPGFARAGTTRQAPEGRAQRGEAERSGVARALPGPGPQGQLEPVVLAGDRHQELDWRVEWPGWAFESVEPQGVRRTGDRTYTASDAFLGIHHGSVGILIQRERAKEAAIDTGSAERAVIACPRGEL
jgi:hypothetical protein